MKETQVTEEKHN